MTEIDWDDAALADLLGSPDGPVGVYIAELSSFAAMAARASVPVRTTSAGRNSDAQPPGWTLESIHPVLGYSQYGYLYGGVNAAADPAIFLETPAEQMHQPYPFLTTALWAVIATTDTGDGTWVWPG